MSAPAFEQRWPHYAHLLDTMQLRSEHVSEIDWYVEKILEGKQRYLEVERKSGVPWFLDAALHGREASFSWSKHVSNGDPVSGRTYNVPAGRIPDLSPPYTWEQTAEDAYNSLKGWDEIQDWSAERICYQAEAWNGWGYFLYRSIESPFLWSFTNHYTKGYYTADGQYDPNAVNKQSGVCAMIYRLAQVEGISIHRHGEYVAQPAPPIPPSYPPPQPPYPPPREWQPQYGTQRPTQPPQPPRPTPPPIQTSPPSPAGFPGIPDEVEDAVRDKVVGSIRNVDLTSWLPKLFALGAVGGAAFTTVETLGNLSDFDEFIDQLEMYIRWSMIFTATCAFFVGICVTRIFQIVWADDDPKG